MKHTNILHATMAVLLIITFAGFAYMHYKSIGCLPIISDKILTNNELFQAILSNNDMATSRLFALTTVLIASATLIVALQFIVNIRTLKEIERKCEDLDKEFADKKSKISRIENVISKVESLAQATSYPLIINTENINKNVFTKIEYYGKLINDSFEGFSTNHLSDKADWKKILFFAQQAKSSLVREAR